MKIGVWVPNKYLNSVRIYYEQVSKRLAEMGVELLPISNQGELPLDVDLYWDPTCTGGKNPHRKFIKRKKPLVATVHGASNFALPHHYTFMGRKQQVKGYWINLKRKFLWFFFRNNIEGIITVSDFAKEEITKELRLPKQKIQAIYHGYDQKVFFPIDDRKGDYLFHVSVFQPVKNLDMLLQAYQKADANKKLPLVVVVPFYPDKIDIEGVTLINYAISHEEVAHYMQHARAFFLPSIRESFGLPLVEAMACGTPVVTSKGSACEEVVSDHGILCDAHLLEDWVSAIESISSDNELWNKLSEKAKLRSKKFSWDKTSELHYDFFKSLL